MSKTALIIFVGAALLFSAPAFAIDGQVLINQSTVLAAGGFPYKITQPGSYKLSGNLIVPNANTDGIDISADNITLDLNGFTIAGPAICAPGSFPVQCSTTGSGTGVVAASQNITVRNGTVRGMGNIGLQLIGSGSLVEDVHADSNANPFGAGIIVLSGIVTHCTATANAGVGILSGDGAGLVASFNVVSYNGAQGIFGGSVVSNNNASFNGEDGITEALLAVNNTMTSNIGFGMNLDRLDGYEGNVMVLNHGGSVTGGTSLGPNLCNGASC